MKLSLTLATYHALKLLHAEHERMLQDAKYTPRQRQLLTDCQRDLTKTLTSMENLDARDLIKDEQS